ncbi:MAG: hypothetical protein AAF961_06565 [Planctomycetota bacterium]
MSNPAEGATVDAAPKKKRGLLTLLKAAGIVTAIIVLEVGAASMLLPGGDETRRMGQQLARAETDGDSPAEDPVESGQQLTDWEDTREVELGSYHVLTYDVETGSSLNVDFDLYGIVLAEEESEFYSLYEASENRISEQVTITMRGMDVSDYSDPGLGLIRRKILEKTNRALGRPLLREVVFPKFSYIER